MHYKVFLDTNIYDSLCHNYRNPQFVQLIEYADKGMLELQINAVVKGEVKRHINDRITSILEKITNNFKSRDLALFQELDWYKDAIKPFDKLKWIEFAYAEFENFLLACHAEEISISNTNVDKLILDYFERRYPFENAKKNEFPDAIIIQSIMMEIRRMSVVNGQSSFDKEIPHSKLIFSDQEIKPGVRDDLVYCIVSGDKGFCKSINDVVSIRPNEDVKVFGSLRDLLSFFAIQNSNAEELQKKLDAGYFGDIIKESIREIAYSVPYNVEESKGYVDSCEIVESDEYHYDIYVLGIQKFCDGTSVARIYVETNYHATLNYEYLNTLESYWDKEDQAYYFTIMTDTVARFLVNTNFIFTLVFDAKDDAEFGDYIDMPNYIDICERDLIEVISSENR